MLIGIGIALGITYFYRPTMVWGISMFPTLNDMDFLIMDRNEYRHNVPEYGDIVIFKHEGKHVIKRLIGNPGDTISFKNGNVYRNGKRLKEDYLNEAYTEPGKETKLKEDEFYFLGDNREVSLDSRDMGPINKDNIRGKVVLRIFPNYQEI